MIPFNKPFLTGKETEYIRQAVESGKISCDVMFTKRGFPVNSNYIEFQVLKLNCFMSIIAVNTSDFRKSKVPLLC